MTEYSSEIQISSEKRKPFRYWFGLILIAAIPSAMGIAAGLSRPFFQVFDCDLYYLYHAIRFNQGLEQAVFAHTGYAYMLFLSAWTSVLNMIQVLPVVTQDGIRSSAQAITHIAEIVVAGRIASIALAILFAFVFTFFAWRLTRNTRLAVSGGLLVASSSGVTFHATIMRPELLSALGIMVGFLAISIAGRVAPNRGFFFLGLSAAAAYFGLMTKTQAVIPALFLPIFALTITSGARSVRADGNLRSAPFETAGKVFVALAALLIAAPFLTAHASGVSLVLDKKPVPAYTWAVLFWIVGSIALYCLLHRKQAWTFVFATAAVLTGFSAAFSLNLFHFSLENMGWNAAFVDHLKQFTPLSKSEAGFSEILVQILSGLPVTFRVLFVDDLSWGITRAAIYVAALYFAYRLARQTRHMEAAAVAVLCAASLGTAFIFSLRGMRPEYDPYFFFMPVLALLIGFASASRESQKKLAPSIAAMFLVLSVVQLAGNYGAFIATPYHSVETTIASFCQWQLENAPFLNAATYEGEKCWTLYTKGVPPGFDLDSLIAARRGY